MLLELQNNKGATLLAAKMFKGNHKRGKTEERRVYCEAKINMHLHMEYMHMC